MWLELYHLILFIFLYSYCMQAERKGKKIYLIVLKRDGIGIGELPYEK